MCDHDQLQTDREVQNFKATLSIWVQNFWYFRFFCVTPKKTTELKKLNQTREFYYRMSACCKRARSPRHKSLTSARLRWTTWSSCTMTSVICSMSSVGNKKKLTGPETRSGTRAPWSSISSPSRFWLIEKSLEFNNSSNYKKGTHEDRIKEQTDNRDTTRAKNVKVSSTRRLRWRNLDLKLSAKRTSKGWIKMSRISRTKRNSSSTITTTRCRRLLHVKTWKLVICASKMAILEK